MINKELLSRHRIDKLKVFIMKTFLEEINDKVEDIKNSERYTAALNLVQEDPEFIKELEKLRSNLANSYANKELGVTLSVKWEAEKAIQKEVDAKLAVTKIDSFDNVVDSITESIQVEDFIG